VHLIKLLIEAREMELFSRNPAVDHWQSFYARDIQVRVRIRTGMDRLIREI
jgi:hypothetical protein